MFLVEHIPMMAEVTKPMCQPSSATLLARFMQGLPGVSFVISTDASYMGWGMVVQAHPSLGGW
eukprot:2135486-Rhodomonas_salina.1